MGAVVVSFANKIPLLSSIVTIRGVATDVAHATMGRTLALLRPHRLLSLKLWLLVWLLPLLLELVLLLLPTTATKIALHLVLHLPKQTTT